MLNVVSAIVCSSGFLNEALRNSKTVYREPLRSELSIQFQFVFLPKTN